MLVKDYQNENVAREFAAAYCRDHSMRSDSQDGAMLAAYATAYWEEIVAGVNKEQAAMTAQAPATDA